MSSESYAHKAAKEVVADWFRSRMRGTKVMVEYPISLTGRGQRPLPWVGEPPSYDEMCAAGDPPSVILDVAVIIGNWVACAVEIKHKHPVTQSKLDKLIGFGIAGIYEVPAGWVLAQVKPPSVKAFAQFCLTDRERRTTSTRARRGLPPFVQADPWIQFPLIQTQRDC